MKKQTIFILGGVFALLMVGAGVGYRLLQEEFSPSSGTTSSANDAMLAPDFTVIDTAGSEVKLSESFGKPIVLNFWATWCGPCKSELPAFDAAYAAYGQEIEFMMINLTDGQRETVEIVKSFVSENGYSFPVYYDTAYSAANAYGVYSVPLTVFIAEDGTIQNAQIGAMSADTLEQYIQDLLGT